MRKLTEKRLLVATHNKGKLDEIRAMISSILAGYAWDERNPFVSEPKRRLRMLSQICASEPV